MMVGSFTSAGKVEAPPVGYEDGALTRIGPIGRRYTYFKNHRRHRWMLQAQKFPCNVRWRGIAPTVLSMERASSLGGKTRVTRRQKKFHRRLDPLGRSNSREFRQP